jgi:DNA replicative helicase MCM subunit Mcm2 (Cdc46/Mcm family)
VVKPGDDVMISGLFIQRWKPPFNRTERPEIEVAVLANNITVLNKREYNVKTEINQQICKEIKNFWHNHEGREIEARNKLLESICPHIYERYPEKLGLILALIGGVPKQCGDDPRIRG